MKTFIKNLFLLPALIAGLGLILAGRVTAQTFTVLHTFISGYPNYEGGGPNDLILSGSTLYGTARDGGSSGKGTVFKVNTDGTGFRILHSFTGGSDGNRPYAGLILSGNTLYGTTGDGGSTGFATLCYFDLTCTVLNTLNSGDGNCEGGGPNDLILSGNTLYGTAWAGGSSGEGTVFKVNTDGTGFT